MSTSGSNKSSPLYAQEEGWEGESDSYGFNDDEPLQQPFQDRDFDEFGDRIYKYDFVAPEMPVELSGEDYYYYCPEEEGVEEQEGEQEVEVPRRMSRRMSRRVSRAPSRRGSSFTAVKRPKERKKSVAEKRTKSLFLHSSPVNFPDVADVQSSSYSQTFLKSTGSEAEDVALMRSLTDSSFSTLHSFLSSFDRILSMPLVDLSRRNLTLIYKESLSRTLEQQGITRANSEGAVHWNIYPTTQNYLFTIQIGDHVHQTRILSRIEDRILSGHVQRMRLPYAWPTDSVWTGHWDLLGMAGSGTYVMPHGVTYQGRMLDGMFHDNNATLTYPNQLKVINCVYERGKLKSCLYEFPDGLVYSSSNPQEWDYCRFPDRRFWSEVQKGLKPAKISQKTEVDPPRRIAPGCFDTNDGFYDPETLMLVSPYGELLRVPTCEEANWIQHYCRKGFFEPADFRPDLFENWFNFDNEFIQLILQQQANYRTGKISYNDLQQFYADVGLLPSWSTFKKKKHSREVEWENFVKSIPSPKPLDLKTVKKFRGHKLHDSNLSYRSNQSTSEKAKGAWRKESRSLFGTTDESTHRLIMPLGLVPKSSRISFRLTQDGLDSREESLTRMAVTEKKRNIPEKMLQYQPLLGPPFTPKKTKAAYRKSGDKRKCSATISEMSKRASTYLSHNEETLEMDQAQSLARSLIGDLINEILLKERERHRRRLKWAQSQPLKANEVKRVKPVVDYKCLSILEEIFDSIPEKEEFCNSDPARICDLKKLAQDKYKVLQYWGTRMFTLSFKK